MSFILANDGIDPKGKAILQAAGHTVQTDKVAQEELAAFIKENDVAALLVRSATKVTAAEMEAGPLKVIGRAGVGLDNIDLKTAATRGIEVVNTPAASSRSVAELVMAHTMGLLRFLPESNREMPVRGTTDFAKLKKSFAKGCEVEGRTMGIIGFGRIGQATAKLALGMGMKVIAHDVSTTSRSIGFHVQGYGEVTVNIVCRPLNDVLAESDIVSLHVPSAKNGPIIGKAEFAKMKDGAVLINASRGGVVDETALLHAMDSGKVAAAGLDVFVNEPTPELRLLNHPRISVTPHIGAATGEAQERIGVELAQKVVKALKR